MATLEEEVELDGLALPKAAPPTADDPDTAEKNAASRGAGAELAWSSAPASSIELAASPRKSQPGIHRYPRDRSGDVGQRRPSGLAEQGPSQRPAGQRARVAVDRQRAHRAHPPVPHVGGKRHVVATTYRTLQRPTNLRAATRYQVGLSAAKARNLRTGRYIVDVAIGTSRSQLGATHQQHVTITR